MVGADDVAAVEVEGVEEEAEAREDDGEGEGDLEGGVGEEFAGAAADGVFGFGGGIPISRRAED